MTGKISRENLGCGSLDDTFRATKRELGISAVSKQTTKKSNTKVDRVLQIFTLCAVSSSHLTNLHGV